MIDIPRMNAALVTFARALERELAIAVASRDDAQDKLKIAMDVANTLADLRDLKRELEIAVNSQLAGPARQPPRTSCRRSRVSTRSALD
jgi:hypothetical protein